jgi:transposase
LAARDALIRAEVGLRNAIGSHLAAVGLVVKAQSRARYLKLFKDALRRVEGYAFLQQIYASLEQLDARISFLDRSLKARAAAGAISARLMTIPGIGPFTALRFIALIDAPERFKSSRAVGVYVGLTARIRQSGNSKRLGSITRHGSSELRRSLFMCAQVLLSKSKKANRLRDWALRLAQRRGKKRAITALARKLAVVMHAVWVSGQPFRA